MLNPRQFLAIFFLLVLAHAAGAETLAGSYTPGTSYYFDHFDPGQKPWKPGQYLNIEEVFKNYQYFEIVFDQDGKGITVIRFVRGSKEGTEQYLLLPDQSLQKTNPSSSFE